MLRRAPTLERFQQKWEPVLRLGARRLRTRVSSKSGTGEVARNGRYAEARLGKLLSLDRRRRTAPPKTPPAGEGEVVIFTGIRYERRPDPGHAGDSPPARPKRKRG